MVEDGDCGDGSARRTASLHRCEADIGRHALNPLIPMLGVGSAVEEPVDDPVMQFFHSATAYDIMPENGKVPAS